jgi:hypothetical protein
MITLFAAPPRSSGFSFTSIASILVHISLFALITHKVATTHRVIERLPLDRYSVHLLDFHSTEPQARKTPGGGANHAPRHNNPDQAKDSANSSSKALTAPGSAGSPSVTRQVPRLLPARQTLVQPDVPKNVVLPDKTPIPLVVLWSANKVPVTRMVPPLPQMPAVSTVQPSLETPLPEEKLADLKLSSTAFTHPVPMPPPSTTSPIVVHGPEETKKAPETTSKQTEKPTPARVVSLSDVRVPEGKVAVPVANQSAAKSPPGSLVPGVLQNPTASGTGDSASKNGQAASGKGAGDHPGAKDDKAAGNNGAGHGADQAKTSGNSDSGQKSSTSSSAPSGSGNNSSAPGQVAAQTGTVAGAEGSAFGSGSNAGQPGAVHISLPRDGQFGAVIVGGASADKYPETAELWSGRLASTVYLHVGLRKSWILQYALPRLAPAALTGTSHLDAPWPFEIVRPNLDTADLDSDALILHGFVNKDGRFEKLEVVFPPQFTQAPMVVNVLKEWQFRPARQDGNFVPVEVLLIIPDELDQ